MSQTLIAVFDSYTDAQSAARELEELGLPRSDIDVHADGAFDETGASTAHPATATSPTPAEKDQDGVMNKIEAFFSNLFGNDSQPEEAGHYREAVRRGGALLTVNNVADDRVDDIEDALEDAGAVDIENRATQWQASGYVPAAGMQSGAAAYSSATGVTRNPAVGFVAADTEGVARAGGIEESGKTLEAIEEDIEVGKRVASKGRVRVYTRPTETAFSESVSLRDENVVVERHAVDRPATSADFVPETIELTETTERPVISKTARVVEEVNVAKVATERTETVTDTLRGTKIEVERNDDPENPRSTGV
jgi:uncharacterized protein (TIGR02271 family)